MDYSHIVLNKIISLNLLLFCYKNSDIIKY